MIVPAHARIRKGLPAQPGWRALLLVALLVMGAPFATPVLWAQEPGVGLQVWRNVFSGSTLPSNGVAQPRDAATTPAESPTLSSTAPFTLEQQVLRLEGLRALRIRSTRPQVSAVLQFHKLPRTASGSAGGLPAWRLRLILINRPGRVSYQQEQDSQLLRDGAFHPRRSFALGERGTLTDLQGEPGRVTELEIQDDGLAELRLTREDGTLNLTLVDPLDGGTPSGSPLPFWHGETLTFADYSVLGAGHTTHGLGELWIGRTLAARANGFVDAQDSMVLARVVATHELLRGRFWSVWLDGGLGVYQETKDSETTQDSAEVTWTFGSTGVYRWYDYGAALHLATVNGPLLMQVNAGWQFLPSWAAVLVWHSFEGYSGNGAGLAVQF